MPVLLSFPAASCRLQVVVRVSWSPQLDSVVFLICVWGADSNHVTCIEPSLSKSTLGLDPHVISESRIAESDTTATSLMSSPSASPSSM